MSQLSPGNKPFPQEVALDNLKQAIIMNPALVAGEIYNSATAVGWGISIDLADPQSIEPAVTVLKGIGAVVTQRLPNGVTLNYQGVEVAVRADNFQLHDVSFGS